MASAVSSAVSSGRGRRPMGTRIGTPGTGARPAKTNFKQEGTSSAQGGVKRPVSRETAARAKASTPAGPDVVSTTGSMKGSRPTTPGVGTREVAQKNPKDSKVSQ